MKQVLVLLKLDLAQYREMAAFAQFGSDLDASTQQLLNRGARLTELLKQAQYSPMSVAEQVVSIFAGVNGFLDKIEVGDVTRFEQALISDMHANNSVVMDTITKEAKVSDETAAKLKEVIGNFAENFV